MAGAKQLVEALKNLKQPVTTDRLTAAIMQFCMSKDALPASIQESVREAKQLGWIRKTTSGFYVISRDGQKNTEKKPKVAKPIDALTPPGESLRLKGVSVPNWRKYIRNVVIKFKKCRTEETMTPNIIADARLDNEGACASSQGMTAIHKTYAELVMDEMFMGSKKTAKVKAQGRKKARPNLPKKQCVRKKPRGTKAVKPLMVMDAHQGDEVMSALSQGSSTNDMTYAELVMESMFLKKLSPQNTMDAHLGAEDRDSIPSACEFSTENIPENVLVTPHPMNTVFQGPEETAKGGQEILPKSQEKQTIRKKPRGKKTVEPLMIMDAHLGDEGTYAKSEGTTSDDISYTDLVIQAMVWQKLRRENAVDVHLNDEGASVSAQSTASIDVQIANPCVSPPATIPVDVPVAPQPMDEVFTGPTGTAQVNSQDEQKTLPQPPKKQRRHYVRKNKAKKKFGAKKAVKSRKIRDAHSDGPKQTNNNYFPFVNQIMGLLRAFKFMGHEENAHGTSQHSQQKAKHGKAAQKKTTKGPKGKKR